MNEQFKCEICNSYVTDGVLCYGKIVCISCIPHEVNILDRFWEQLTMCIPLSDED